MPTAFLTASEIGPFRRSFAYHMGKPEALWLPEQSVFSDMGSTFAADGDSIRQWGDATGHGHDLGEATNKPTLQTDELNGLPIVRFAGDNDVLSCTAITPGDFTFVILVRLNASNALSIATVLCQEAVGGTPINGRIYYAQSGSTLNGAWRNDANGAATVLTTDENFLNQWAVVGLTLEGTALKLYVNGVLKKSGTTLGGAVTPTLFMLGGRPNSTGYANMDVAMVAAYKRALQL